MLPELFAAPGAHSRARQEADLRRYGAPMAAWFEGFLDRLFGAPGAIARGSVSDAAGLEEPREERV
jgi:hypothetical protein